MKRSLVTLSLLLGGALLSGCVDERVVQVPGPVFTEPNPSALNFVGYSDQAEKLTVCGNCHVGQQENWEGTAHARAWASLVAENAQNRAECQACHSTNTLGNPQTGSQGGYLGSKEARYQDVQCEGCHGPGLAHVRRPDGTQPLAPMRVGLDMTQGCGECHRGAFSPFVEEWAQSAHGRVPNQANPGGRAECEGCHTGEGFLKMQGVRAEYLEKDTVHTSLQNNLPITCATCHDPHDAEFEGQLRKPVNTPDIDQNLCAQCHKRTVEPNPTSRYGLSPHAPEASLLVGEAGYFFPGTELDRGKILGTHGGERNPRLCATCHVTSFSTQVQGTRISTTGHLFNAIPCVDAQGRPQPREVQCAVTAQARSFKGCTGSGCHGTDEAAASALLTAAARLQRLATELEELLKQVDPGLTAPGGEIDPTKPTLTVAEGAYFNLELAQFRGELEQLNKPLDPTRPGILTWGSAVHNPFMMESLLLTSIEQVERTYGVRASRTLPRTALLQQPAR